MTVPKTLNISSLLKNDVGNNIVLKFLIPEAEGKTDPLKKMDIIDGLRLGLPKQAVNTVLQQTTISRQQLSAILHISPRQLNRYEEKDKLPAEQSGFLYEFARLYLHVQDTLGDAATADEWLNRPNMALANQSPIDLLDTAEGFRLVDDLLSQIDYGFYS